MGHFGLLRREFSSLSSGVFFYVRALVHIKQRTRQFGSLVTQQSLKKVEAYEFEVFPRRRYRLFVAVEEEVRGLWITLSQIDLTTFASRPRRQRQPAAGPPPPPAGPPPPAAGPSGDQVVPTDAPGPMRQRRRRRTPAARSSQAPAGSPYQQVPRWGVLGEDILFTCPICTNEAVHSLVKCRRCGVRPACRDCLVCIELDLQPSCPFCRYRGPQ
jgi:hypothetical protein